MRLEEAIVEQNIRKKGKSEFFAWNFFKRYIVKNDGEDRVVDFFALAIYGLVIFLKVPGHVEVVVIDVIEQIASQANPVPAIVAETLRTLNFCKRNENGDLTCCIQMLYVWIRSHFWGTNPAFLKCYMGDFSPITHFCKMVWPRNQTRVQWVAALQNLESTDITWKAPWMPRESILYGYGDKLWVSLLRVWGAISYTPLLVRRQYLSTQFIPATHGLN